MGARIDLLVRKNEERVWKSAHGRLRSCWTRWTILHVMTHVARVSVMKPRAPVIGPNLFSPSNPKSSLKPASLSHSGEKEPKNIYSTGMYW